jgi:Putative phage metallopeptidase
MLCIHRSSKYVEVERVFICRPFPPESITAVDARITFAPAPELVEWATATFIEDDGKLFNPDHFHLQSASMGMLWTNLSNSRKGRRIVGQCEEGQPSGMMGKWGKALAEERIIGWFGHVPIPIG